MLELKDVNVIFNPNTINEKHALKDISFTFEDGDFVSVIGNNGAGKSTLLKTISGTNSVASGRIYQDGKDITNDPEYKRAKNIGHLHQNPMFGTAPHMTIAQNLALAYQRTRFPFALAVTRQDKLFFMDKLKELDLGLEDRLDDEVGLLSGGQRQALALLMATIHTPKILLLDEHTAALDPAMAEKIMNLTQAIIAKNHITTLMVTHHVDHALQYGNKMLVMKDGMIMKVCDRKEKDELNIERVLQMYNNQLSDRFILG